MSTVLDASVDKPPMFLQPCAAHLWVVISRRRDKHAVGIAASAHIVLRLIKHSFVSGGKHAVFTLFLAL